MIVIEVPLALPSRANTDGSQTWRVRQKTVKHQRTVVGLALLAAGRRPRLPVTVRLTRVAPRKLDAGGGGNVSGALKAVRDEVARWFGVDDADPLIVWLPCEQAVDGRPRYTAARIEIWEGQATCGECGQAKVPA